MKSTKKGKEKVFKPNVELMLELGKNRWNEWEEVVKNPRAFVKSDCKFEPMEMNNIKKEKKQRG